MHSFILSLSMSTIYVHTLFKKCLSCDTKIIVPLKSIKNSSNHVLLLISNPFVGSSNKRISGLPNKAWASNTYTLSLSFKFFIKLVCISLSIPNPDSKIAASLSASQPFKAANSSSSLATFIPSSLVKSSFI